MAEHRSSVRKVVGLTSPAPLLPEHLSLEQVAITNREESDQLSPRAIEQTDNLPVAPCGSMPRILEEIIEAPVTRYSNSNLRLIRCAIKSLRKIKEKLYEDEFQKMAENSIERANTRLANACWSETEKPSSSLYPRECLQQLEKLSGFDREFMAVLLRSGRVKACNWPSFAGFIDKTNGPPEYQFMIGFEFGFSLEQIHKTVVDGCSKLNVPSGVCSIVADFVGDSYFEIKLTVYYDKTKTEWSEQDGEAWIFHRGSRGKIEDVVNFDKDDRIYYVEQWPLKGLVVATEDAPKEMSEEKLVTLERKLVAWLCCQMIWFVLGENLSPNYCHSYIVRNAVRKLIFVLKGWFTGLLLGESFEPDGIVFETSEKVE